MYRSSLGLVRKFSIDSMPAQLGVNYSWDALFLREKLFIQRGTASLIGEHWSAVGHYLATGDDSRLRRLEGRRVAGITLLTDPDAIEEWERRGELAIEDVYDLTT